MHQSTFESWKTRKRLESRQRYEPDSVVEIINMKRCLSLKRSLLFSIVVDTALYSVCVHDASSMNLIFFLFALPSPTFFLSVSLSVSPSLSRHCAFVQVQKIVGRQSVATTRDVRQHVKKLQHRRHTCHVTYLRRNKIRGTFIDDYGDDYDDNYDDDDDESENKRGETQQENDSHDTRAAFRL